MIRVALAAFATALIVVALASGNSGASASPTVTGRDVVHPNGLVLTLADSLFVQQTTDGFIVSGPGPKDFRPPAEVSVALIHGRCSEAYASGERTTLVRDAHGTAFTWARPLHDAGDSWIVVRQSLQDSAATLAQFNLACYVVGHARSSTHVLNVAAAEPG